jgi:hypothetical protein
MQYFKLKSTLLISAIFCAQSLAQTTAPAPAPAVPATWSAGPVNFSGLVDGYYSYASNHPASRTNLYRNFDVRANSVSINMAKLTLEHDADPIGFKLDLGVGRAMDIFNFQDKANGFDNLRYVPQAYVTFKPKNGNGFQMDFGKFYTSAGAEPTETHLNWNYSRAFMYANGPYYHFGLRTSMPVNKYLTAGFQLVNGWNNVKDNNSGKTMGFTTAVTVGKFAWLNNYYTGPEQNDTNKGWRNFYDTVFTFNPSNKVSTYLNIDYGTQKFVAGKGSNDWIAVAGAARFQLTKAIAFSPRAEYYYDKDGFITGTAQRLKEITLTGEYKLAKGFLTRLEYRRDWSDQPVFERENNTAASRNQSTVLIGLVAFFGPKR